ncbi:MAG: sigma-70 family RNA polymerase sigma factor [Bacteroidetes bacterium]|nr:sigma-70 family RNA polymerase sigma factor [Bacteroidota bacterium]
MLRRCLKKEVAAEYQLYHRFAPKMNGICLRYGGNEREAEDILQNGFVHLFSHLNQFKFEGSLECWIERIFLNAAINYYKKNLKFRQYVDLSHIEEDVSIHEDALSAISQDELLAIIQSLPVGYRTIFNMYVIENYQHNEIASLLGISEGTSKSQLFRAKAMVKRMLKERETYYKIG